MENIELEKHYQKSIEMMNFNNQLKLLKDQLLDINIMYSEGSQINVDHTLLQICKNYIDLNRTTDVILLDNFRNPVMIADLTQFYDDAWNLYQKNLNQFYMEYRTLVTNKGKI